MDRAFQLKICDGWTVESSSRKWQQIYFNTFSVTIVLAILITILSDRCTECTSWQDWLELIKSGTGDGILYATAIISFMEVGRMVLLPADYLRQKFIEPLKERQKEEGREEGRNEGRAEMRAEIVDWMERKEEAEREGREFDEPMPGAEYNGTRPRRNGS